MPGGFSEQDAQSRAADFEAALQAFLERLAEDRYILAAVQVGPTFEAMDTYALAKKRAGGGGGRFTIWGAATAAIDASSVGSIEINK